MMNGTKLLSDLMAELVDHKEPRKVIREFAEKHEGLLKIADEMLELENGEFKGLLKDVVDIGDINHVIHCKHCCMTTRDLCESSLRHCEMLFETVTIPPLVWHIAMMMNLIVKMKTNQSQDWMDKYLMPRILDVMQTTPEEMKAQVEKGMAHFRDKEHTDH